jgi:hypothetical protein
MIAESSEYGAVITWHGALSQDNSIFIDSAVTASIHAN